jgi:antitoxin ParD1/3/4
MRTNIDIDDDLMAAAMSAGAFKTKKEAVEAGLALLKRQADYARLLALKGKLRWGWDDEEAPADVVQAQEPPARFRAQVTAKAVKAVKAAKPDAIAKAPAAKPKGPARGRR